MNKGLVVAIVVVLAAAAAGAVWYFVPLSGEAVARQALMGNGSATCTYVDPDTGDEGTFYARNGDIRVSATTEGTVFGDQGEQQNQEEVLTHMLFKDEVGYIWSEGEDQGIEFSAEETEDNQAVDDEAVDLRDLDEEEFEQQYEELQMSCRRGADASLFDLPEGVEFVDFSQMFNQFSEIEPGTNDEAPTQEEMEELQRQFQENQ